jgi:hypothetical protein
MASKPAPMGYIGGISIFGRASVRATSSSLNMKQTIDHPDVIDGTVDWTIYQLKGIETEGDVQFPVLADPSSAGSLDFLFDIATQRDNDGELTQFGPIVVTYGHQKGRRFNDCRVSQLELRATAGERMDATCGFWGTDAVIVGGTSVAPVSGKPIRVLAWADVLISGTGIGSGCDVRELSLTINNNLSRNYTFCPSSGYFPNNISTGKRNISGQLGFQGFAPTEELADQNQNKTSPDATITIATKTGFSKTFKNIIYEYQSLEAQPSVITSTVNWYAHADGGGKAFE